MTGQTTTALDLPGPTREIDGDDGDDAAIVRRAQAGDESAFALLYRRYADRVYRFGLVRIGHAHDAEDLVQQTFLRVVEALPRYEDRGLPFGAWVFRIARRVLVDRHRSGGPAPDALDEQDPANMGHVEVDHAMVTVEREMLRQAMAELTSDQRDVIAYRFFADLSARETGRLMGRDEAAVRALQARALGALRRGLAGEAGRVMATPGEAGRVMATPGLAWP